MIALESTVSSSLLGRIKTGSSGAVLAREANRENAFADDDDDDDECRSCISISEKKTKTKMSESHWKRNKRKEQQLQTINCHSQNKEERNISRTTTNNNSYLSRRIIIEDKVCLRSISHSALPPSKSNAKMLTTTIVVLTALATCYGLALSASTSSLVRSADLIMAESGKCTLV